MRNIVIALLFIPLFFSCSRSGPEGYRIDLKLEESAGKWAKLLALDGDQYAAYDSVKVDDSDEAVLEKSVDGVRTMYLTLGDERGSIRLLMENADYTITGTLDDPVITTTGKAQGDLNKYLSSLKPLSEKLNQKREAVIEARNNSNTSLFDSLRDEYYVLYDERLDFDSAYVSNNPGSFASVLILRNSVYDYGAEELEASLNSLDEPLHQLDEYKFMAEKLAHMKAVAVGQHYTDFEMETPEGEELKVSDVHKGNVLLIDFWAAWCGPCRRANPELVEIYKDYHDSGFDILGVSFDRNREDWVKAIAEDRLTWHQMSDLQYWDSKGAELYGVSAIPHSVLIDREGIITAKNLEGDELREAIESLL